MAEADVVLWHRQEHPGGRGLLGERRRLMGNQPRGGQAMGGKPGKRPVIVGGTGHNGKWHCAHQRLPAPPTRQLHQIIGPHQPHEPRPREPDTQRPHGIHRENRAQRALDIGRHDPPSIRQRPRRRQPLAQRGHPTYRLQWIARRHQQPNLVQPQMPPRQLRHMQMPRMRRIERPPEQTDPAAPPIAVGRDGRYGQGRICPVPTTW